MAEKCKRALLTNTHGIAEILVLLLYIAGVSAVFCFHELWFDEAQAWQIARCASLREILFEIPHYEGHPQLWHLLLVPFAKLGAPYELTMLLVNLAFCTASVCLVLWKSPFPKFLRCLIPFSFFFFYQYGVISRPYSIMMLAFLLAAMAYSGRNQKPLRYILALSLLCASSAYGIVVAGALCLVWVWEIFEEYRKNRNWKKLPADRRCWTLAGILVLAVCFLLCLLPAEDCFYGGGEMPLIEHAKKLWNLLVFPFDTLFGSYHNYTNEYVTTGGIAALLVGSAVLWALLIPLLRENKVMLLYFVPYVLFAVVLIFLQFSPHHTGIFMLHLLFVFWIVLEREEGMQIPSIFVRIWGQLESKLVRRICVLVGAVACVIPVAFSVVSSVLEIKYAYGNTGIADFIKEHQLEDRKIMTEWKYLYAESDSDNVLDMMILDETLPADLQEIETHYPYLCGSGASVNPYFEENVFMNFNADDPDTLYMKWLSSEEPEEQFALWREQGLPEVIFGLVPLDEIYSEEELEGVTYYWVDTIEHGRVWKLYYSLGEIKVYIRSDVLEDYPQFEIQKY